MCSITKTNDIEMESATTFTSKGKYNTLSKSIEILRVNTRTGKPGKMGRHFPVRENQGILNRLEKSGKITQNTGKLGEFEINII